VVLPEFGEGAALSFGRRVLWRNIQAKSAWEQRYQWTYLPEHLFLSVTRDTALKISLHEKDPFTSGDVVLIVRGDDDVDGYEP